MPHLRVVTAELLGRLHPADTGAGALLQLDQLFQQRQREFIEAEGFGQ